MAAPTRHSVRPIGGGCQSPWHDRRGGCLLAATVATNAANVRSTGRERSDRRARRARTGTGGINL